MVFQNIIRHFYENHTKPISQPSIFSTVTGLQARWSKVQITYEQQIFSHLQNDKTSSGAHPASYSADTGGGFIPDIKWPDHEFNHSPLSSAQATKERNSSSTPSWGEQGKYIFSHVCKIVKRDY